MDLIQQSWQRDSHIGRNARLTSVKTPPSRAWFLSKAWTFRKSRRRREGALNMPRLMLIIVALLASWAAAAADLTGRPTVIDGDATEIHGQRIRLFGIDAPEAGQPCEDADGHAYRCGQEAALALANHIAQRAVVCEPRDTDHSGSIVAVCRIGGEDLNAWLASQGWAIAYRRYSTDYIAEEEAARIAKRGIWSGQFVSPAIWRRDHRPPYG